MEFKQAFEKLKQSKEFKNWNKKHTNLFLSCAFKTLEENKEQPWQLGFYHESTDKMVTFIVDEDEIEMQEEDEIFKKPGTEVIPLEIERVKIPFKKILYKTKDFQKKKYSKELINKTIAILQNLEEYGTVWNITYLTHSFNTLNIKVNAENGKIMHHSIDALMSFTKK